ncbi:MAG TPA: hypothetical protein VLF60_02755 [Candidatus Saccharimonadales bacterium]|nr:hypothetical protein [Candidatus Saccharimonadales bacterium]
MIDTAPWRSEFDVPVTPQTVRRTQQLLVQAAFQAMQPETQIPRDPGARELSQADRANPQYKIVDAPIGRHSENIGSLTARLIADVRLPETVQQAHPELARDAEYFRQMSPGVRERLAMAALFGNGREIRSIEDTTKGRGVTIEVRDGVYAKTQPPALPERVYGYRRTAPTVAIPGAHRNAPAVLSAPVASTPPPPRGAPPQWPIPPSDEQPELQTRSPKPSPQPEALLTHRLQEAIAVTLEDGNGWIRARSMNKLTKKVLRLLTEFSGMDELISEEPNSRRLDVGQTVAELRVQAEHRWKFQRVRAMRALVRVALEKSRGPAVPVHLLQSSGNKNHVGVATPKALKSIRRQTPKTS